MDVENHGFARKMTYKQWIFHWKWLRYTGPSLFVGRTVLAFEDCNVGFWGWSQCRYQRYLEYMHIYIYVYMYTYAVYLGDHTGFNLPSRGGKMKHQAQLVLHRKRWYHTCYIAIHYIAIIYG